MLLRLLTYNIHKCVGGLDRRYSPARIAQAIAHYSPDIVLLQEVAEAAPRRNHEQQIEVLGALLGYRHRTYFAHAARRGGGRYGNGILSRYPILEASNIDLSVPLKKRRSALHAKIRVHAAGGAKGRTIHVYNLHLGLSGLERKLQLRRFLGSHPFARLHARAPIVVGGDFNDLWGTLGRKILAPAGMRGVPQRMATFPAFAPLRALDTFYLRGDIRLLRALRSRLPVSRLASDHLPLIADFALA